MAADLAGGDGEGFVAEHVALLLGQFLVCFRWGRKGGHTAKMLTTPRMLTTIPEAMTMRQKAVPRES